MADGTPPHLIELLKIATEAWASMNATCSQAFSIFAAGNAVLVEAAVDATGRKLTVVLAGGVVAAVIWGALQLRLLGHLEMHEERVRLLEEQAKIPPELSISTRNKAAHRRIQSLSPFSAREVMRGAIGIGFVAWTVALVWHLAK
jgi:hypothetical protein